MSRKICVVGTGYVGLITSIGFADFGNSVTAVDKDSEKIKLLRTGRCPIYEPGVEKYLRRHSASQRLQFSTDIASQLTDCTVIVIAVGTPMDSKGDADLCYIDQVLESIAPSLGHKDSAYQVIIVKSTVPVGTNRKIRNDLERMTGKKAGKDFDVVSNPEFLREGRALDDFLHPDRVVIGCEHVRAREVLSDIYRPLEKQSIPLVWCDLETAELIKYTGNAFLAAKIAFINEIANFAEAVGANIHQISKAVGMDFRISPAFLQPGPGYGGSCFPKDTRALIRMGEDCGVDMSIIRTVVAANEYQKKRMVDKLCVLFELQSSSWQDRGTDSVKSALAGAKDHAPDGALLKGKTIALCGLAFKQGTDDIRESSAIAIVQQLLDYGALVRAYDPQAMDNFAQVFSEITYCRDAYVAAEQADAMMVVTEWDEFRALNLQRLKEIMRGNIILDTRNILEPENAAEQGFVYQGVGR